MTISAATESGRLRRASSEVDKLILDAARELFAANGYTGTSVREVADKADVHEPMVYRRYATKAELFEASVLEPFDRVVTGYLETWAAQADDAGPTENLTRSWVPPLYEVMRGERQLILALLAAGEYHAEELPDGTSLVERLRRIVERMTPQALIEIARRPLPGVALPENIIVSLGMILGVALLDVEHEFSVDHQRLVEEMVQMTLYGVTARERPAPAEQPITAGRPAPAEQPNTAERPDTAGRPNTALAPETNALLDRVADAERRAIRAELELELLRRRLGPDPA